MHRGTILTICAAGKRGGLKGALTLALYFVHTNFTRRRGVVGVRNRRDFSIFDPHPGRPHFSNFGPPAERGHFFKKVFGLKEKGPV